MAGADYAESGTDVAVAGADDAEPATGLTETGVDAAAVGAEATEGETDTLEVYTAAPEPDPQPQQTSLLQLEEDLLQSGLLVERTGDGTLKVNLSSDGMYDFDSARIKDGARPALEKLAAVLLKHDELTLQVVGHTDSSGAAEYNLHLSYLRSKAVADYLISQGLTDSSIEFEGRGDQDTRLEHSPGYNPDLKRRVEIYIMQAREN